MAIWLSIFPTDCAAYMFEDWLNCVHAGSCGGAYHSLPFCRSSSHLCHQYLKTKYTNSYWDCNYSTVWVHELSVELTECWAFPFHPVLCKYSYNLVFVFIGWQTIGLETLHSIFLNTLENLIPISFIRYSCFHSPRVKEAYSFFAFFACKSQGHPFIL